MTGMVKKMKRFRLFRRKKNKFIIDEIPVRANKAQSLGVGTLSSDGISILDFVGNSKGSSCCGTDRTLNSSFPDYEQHDHHYEEGRLQALRHMPQQIKEVVKDKADQFAEKVYSIPERIQNLKPDYKRLSSTFLRVADLQMTSRVMAIEQQVPNFHHASQDPPPGMELDPQEEWVALDDGAGSAAPIAPYAVAALASFGHKTAMDESMWKCEGKTDRLLKTSAWKNICWQGQDGPIVLPQDFAQAGEVTIWSGTFIHGLYGSDLPAVRSMGIVNMSPRALTDLMVDSSRTKEYNKMSLGRTDLLVLHDNLHDEQGPEGIPLPEGPFGKSITKVMRAETQPPVIRKPLQFVSILHATKLADGYLIVSRAVTQASEASSSHDSILSSEILMGVNVIREIEGEPNKCLMINVNHIRTPMVPLFVARRIALSAAPGFIHDLNTLC